MWRFSSFGVLSLGVCSWFVLKMVYWYTSWGMGKKGLVYSRACSGFVDLVGYMEFLILSYSPAVLILYLYTGAGFRTNHPVSTLFRTVEN
ncbi:uncharacterized protein BO66DRAFT_10817 [Aspergillus aculeatinus CBS 121060]|uniref:Uncharacterized protein n=1 Tax=Aspergillus aculeatinus CBS 121060 TaxID=1448322 RepID=A0ACD1HPX8_9EURO|nr:hypothetical protein BO66DRAFT_10817 [Aspergillus aculeatinus CBS 121060]RAH75556.1 hypothetical protein BO66DRAFT_10817 [Aspergillus aculeatinus CBS 121060]